MEREGSESVAAKGEETTLIISRDCVHLFHDVHTRLVGHPGIRVVVDRRVAQARSPRDRRRRAQAILVRAAGPRISLSSREGDSGHQGR